MKLVFLCGSLEPGLDGVGDYVRRLAVALMQQQHEVALVALHDTFLTSKMEGEQLVGTVALPVLRLPASWKPDQRFDEVAAYLTKTRPDWVSLQYVGFGLHRYGLPWHLLWRLRPAIGNAKLHTMLHELWCGMDTYAGRKEKLLGAAQKGFLKLLLRRVKPQGIFTSIRHYANELTRLGVSANLVPVFSNIPVDEWGSEQEWQQTVEQAGLAPLLQNPGQWLVVGFFGTVYACPGLLQLLQHAAEAAASTGRKLGVLSIGHNRLQSIRTFTQAIPGVDCWQTGGLAVPMLNRALALMDLGVVTSPADRVNKSGTAIAFLERGIPVLISAEDNTYYPAEMEAMCMYQVTGVADVVRSMEAAGGKLPQNRLAEAAASYAQHLSGVLHD